MDSKLVNIVNLYEAIKTTDETISAIGHAPLHRFGDYGAAIRRVPANQKQKAHFHTYGDIDIFIIIEGSGFLHLAKVEDDKVVEGSEEVIPIKAGDNYPVCPYTLHALEAGDSPILVLNVAPDAHVSLAKGESAQRGTDIFFPKE